MNQHIGSSLDTLLEADGLLDSIEVEAKQKVKDWQQTQCALYSLKSTTNSNIQFAVVIARSEQEARLVYPCLMPEAYVGDEQYVKVRTVEAIEDKWYIQAYTLREQRLLDASNTVEDEWCKPSAIIVEKICEVPAGNIANKSSIPFSIYSFAKSD